MGVFLNIICIKKYSPRAVLNFLEQRFFKKTSELLLLSQTSGELEMFCRKTVSVEWLLILCKKLIKFIEKILYESMLHKS